MTKGKAISLQGYEFAQPHGRVMAFLLVQYPILEIFAYYFEWPIPVPLRTLSIALQACMIGIMLSKDLKIWKKTD